MANVLLQSNQPKTANNPILNIVSQAKAMGPSSAVFNQLYATNQQFRDFANSMQGKTPEQAFRERGLDFNQFRGFHW